MSQNNFSPDVFVALSDTNCGISNDLTITVVQDSNEVDMDTAIFIADDGYFNFSTIVPGDNIGLATMNLSLSSFSADLILNSIISANVFSVDAIDQLTGANLGTFNISNLIGGGVEIIAVSPDDGNNFTSGLTSSVVFNNIFVNPLSNLINFSSLITSELGDVNNQSTYINLSCISCSINLIDSSDISCFGANDGFISVQGSGTNPLFAYSLQVFNSIIGSWTEIANSPQSGSYTQLSVTFPNLHADSFLLIMTDSLSCQDTLAILLTEPPLISTSQTVVTCDSFLWDGITYTTTGLYTNIYTAIDGCDSVVNLDLTINDSYNDTIIVSICDSNYFWDGVIYNSSGIYTNSYLSSSGCDSIVSLDLSINLSFQSTDTITACDSLFWSGSVYYSSGFYSQNYTTSTGCDSILNLELIIDISGCTDSLALNFNPSALCDDGSCIYLCNVLITDSSNISCYGYNDGFVQVEGNGAANNFNYQLQLYDSLFMTWITVGQSPLSGVYTSNPVLFPNLFAGCYRVIMSDGFFCNDTSTICLNQPQRISILENITNANNVSNNNGSIVLNNFSGGFGSFYFTWTGPNGFTSNSQNIFNLESGIYNLIVYDDSSCSRNYMFFVDLLVPGCIDSSANNYNPLATIDDSSCCYLNFYNDDLIICLGDTVELLYSNFNTIDSSLWSSGSTQSSLFVSPSLNTTYWLTQYSNGFSCSDTINVVVSCLDFSPSVSVSLSNLNCGLTDLTISVSQDSNEVDMESAIFTSDFGSFTISSMTVGDNIGNAIMTFGSNTFNANLLVNSIVFNQIIVEAIDQLSGLTLGTFSITNLVNGGVEIIADSPGDGNSYTNGNTSLITFVNVFDSPSNGFLTFTSNIISELNDFDVQTFPFTLNCIDFSPDLVVSLSDLNCGVITDLTISVSQDSLEVDIDTAIFISDAGYFNLSSLSVGDNIGTAAMNLSLSLYNANLIVSAIISTDEILVNAIDQLTGANLGTFTISNLLGGGIEIIAISPDDGNFYTLAGNLSTVTFDSLFVNSSSGLLTFTGTMISEQGEIEFQTSSFLINTLTSFFTIFRCETYTWNGNIFDSTGIYVDTFSSIIGCDSVVTLNLTIYNNSFSYDTLNVCDGILWNGVFLDSSGQYLDTLTNSSGCDSLVYLDLTINSNSSYNYINSCSNYLMNGILYDTSGVYIDTLVNSLGCDSIVTLDLTINYESNSLDSVIACDSYNWNGNIFTVSGVYDTLLLNSAGCDSLATLVLTLNNSSSSFDTVVSCYSYNWNGSVYTVSGTYDSLFVNSSGCDSLANLILTINDSSSSTISIIACDTFAWDGVVYDTSGFYTNIYSSNNGCDSIVNLNLTINYSSSLFLNITACGFYVWDGVVYDSSGVYTNLYSDTSGCDSLVTIDLLINNITTVFDTVIICDTLFWNGNVYTSSGNYVDTILGNSGCDSIVNLNLTVNSSSSSTNFISSCDSYFWLGQTLVSSGIYDTILQNSLGCDSFTQIYLTIIPTIYNFININSCGPFDWNSNIYDSTGTYYDTLIAASGCDSVVSLNLVVTPIVQVSSIITDVDCFGNSTGLIDLQIISGTYPFTYLWSNNSNTQDINNLLGDSSYTCSIIDSAGCTLDTTFYVGQPLALNVIENVVNVSCFSGNDGNITLNIFGGIVPYSVDWGSIDTFNLFAGYYAYEVTDSNGCIYFDSVEVIQPNPIQININQQDVSCFGYNDGSIEVNVIAGSGVPAYSYDWVGPNLFFANTNNIYNLFAGNYNLIITDANGCILDTSIILNQPANIPQTTNIQISNYSGYNIRCKGDNSGWVSVIVSGGYEPHSYLWSNLSTSDSIYDLYAGTYTLEVTDSLGCVIIFDFPLIEPALPLTSSIVPTTDYNGYNISCFSFSDGALQALASGGVPNYDYYWNSVKISDSITNLTAGQYQLTVYDKNDCESINFITLTQPDSLYIELSSFTDTCSKGVGKSEITTYGGVSPFSYQWSNGVSSSTISNFYEGEYFVDVFDANLCQVSDSVQISNLPSPIIDFGIFPDNQRLFDQLDDPIVFVDFTDGLWQNIASWIWDYDDGSFGSDSISYHSFNDADTYVIMLTTISEYNCIDTLTKELIISDYNLYVPNSFTPFSTNDNLNEVFKAYGIGVNKFEMEIYNRWGQKIFSTNSIEDGWDGLSNDGAEMPAGLYIYYIKAENIYGEDFKYQGQFNLFK